MCIYVNICKTFRSLKYPISQTLSLVTIMRYRELTAPRKTLRYRSGNVITPALLPEGADTEISERWKRRNPVAPRNGRK